MTKQLPVRFLTAGIAAVGCSIFGLTCPAMAIDEKVGIDILQDDAQSIVLHYEFGDFDRKTIRVNGEEYTSIKLAGEVNSTEAGSPSLPRVSRSVIIPGMASMEALILDAEYYDIEGIDIAPSKGSIFRTVDPSTVPWNFGPAYSTDAFWPAEPVSLSDPYIMRAHRGQTVRVSPFQYNPMTRTLRVYRNMTVAVDNVGVDLTNAMPHDAQQHDGGSSFHTIYSKHFLNYHRDLRSNPISEEGEMLVISHPTFMDNMAPLVDHKNSIGIATTLVSVNDVGSSWSQIHDYIGNMYNSSDLVYVLLVGDASHIPATSSAGGLCDPCYAKQAGSDDYVDVLMGRFSANNDQQVDTQVERSITYEADQWTLKDEYLRAQGAASTQGPGDQGEMDHEHMEIIGEKYLEWDVTWWNQEDDNGGSISTFLENWNLGLGHIQYTGHGWQGGWSNGAPVENSHINSLTNTEMLPYIITVGCVVGEYNTGDCFCEATQWATHNNQPTGAIAHFGSTINQYWDEPMRGQDAMVDLMCAEEYFTMGALAFMGCHNMVDAYGQSGIDMLDTWHIFGDPSLTISGTAQPPTGMRVTGSNLSAGGPNGGPFAPASTTYTLLNYEDYEIDYDVSEAISWVDMSGTLSGSIPAGGSVEITASINQLVASGLGNGPYSGQIQFDNITNNDGTTAKPANLHVGTPQMVLEWDMEQDPGWTYEGEWSWSSPTGQGGEYGGPDPVGGQDGQYCVNYNPNGDYVGYLPETNMTTAEIDCTNLTEVSVKFDRWLGVETDYYDHAHIRISTDGATWDTIWSNSGEVADSSWSQKEYDISSYADGEERVWIRWVMGETDSIWNYCGWNIDNVQIWAVDSNDPADCPGDYNGDMLVNVADLLLVIQMWQNPYTVNELLTVIANWNHPCP